MSVLDSVRRDFLFATRSLAKTPLLTAAIVLTLALGIGVNTSVFGIVNALLLRPLPVRDGDRIVVLASRDASGVDLGALSLPDIEDFRSAAPDVFEDVVGYSVGFLGLAREGVAAERVLATTVTAGYFGLLDLRPAAGRLLSPDDRGALIVLGHSAWQRRFDGDPAVVGTVVRVDGRPCTIVGVAPPAFLGTFAFSDSELYLPVDWRGDAALENRAARPLHALARLLPQVSVEQAQAAATAVAARLALEHPDTNADLDVRVVPEQLARPEENQVHSNTLGATTMLALVGMVSILAAANVTNLLLARVIRRRRELAIRAALGADRGSLIRQLVVEVATLAALAGCVGTIFAAWVTRALAAVRLPGDLPVRFDFGFDTRVAAYVVTVTLLMGFLAGVAPAVRASGASPLHFAGDARSTARARDRIRAALAISQIALSFVLLVAAGSFGRSLLQAERTELGFRAAGVLNLQMDVGQLGYDEEQGRRFFDAVARRVAALPGVESSSFASTVPLGYVRAGAELEAEGGSSTGLSAGKNSVSPSYFTTMGVPLVRGRAFSAGDDERAPPVAIVNQRLADALWPGSDPLGRRFKQRGDERWLEVVGVTSTGKYESLFEAPRPFFYLPQAQEYTALRALHVRTTLDPQAVLTAIERTIRDYEPALALYDVQTMERALGSGPGLFPVRIAAAATAAFGAIGFALAVVGTYAVVSYLTSQRTHEIAVRMVVGAPRRRIMDLVLRDGARFVIVGIATGIAISIGVGSLLGRFLFAVSPYDPATLGTVAAVLGSVALLACAVPSWRAAAVEPIGILRSE